MSSSWYPHHLYEQITENERNFSKKLFVHSQLIDLIENVNLQKCALESIPVDEFNIEATRKFSLLEGDVDVGLEDCLLLELLQWFKFSFFTWVDSPECHKCGQNTENRGTVAPTPDEHLWLARTVENYYCTTCKSYTRFPRYNHPRKLLETRKGRCGEWGSCFALLCRALDFDTRVVVDWNDHIWVEYFSPSKQRWVHCDPCENICDQPLIYEVGWKKKLSFIIAFSKNEIQDVTWRYTRKFSEVIKRRKASKCRECFVLDCINLYTEKCRSDKTSEQIDLLCRRQALELAEFLSPPKSYDETSGGRTSGSIAWRLARGEAEIGASHTSYIFNLNAIEIEQKHFHLQYSCALDEYIRVSDNSAKEKNWTSWTFEVKDIFRKLEADWKMAYLARTEGSPTGIIVWKFNFEKSGLAIRTVRVNLDCATFDSGKVKWHLSPIKNSGPRIEKVFIDKVLGFTPLENEDFKGALGLTITAELTAGSGQIAWQHAQLFRQELSSREFPFEVEIFLEELQT